MSTVRRQRIARWVSTAVEIVLVVASIVYIASSELWALLAWVGLTVVYLAVGLAVSWGGRRENLGDRTEILFIARWAWVLPLISSGAGVNSAILALIAGGAKEPEQEQILLAVAASVGVVLSWTMLQVGFAHIYRALDASADRAGIRFPGDPEPSLLNYLYFAFTVGTAFATSDAQVTTIRIRRVVMLHSVISFFYNALVVAVAFQVLQRMISG
ncbi:DUF1345 domain-containing protein [Microbacterium sp. NPDC089189]|uniref:DUF1345 domain-containing protein n=1 Tax=Microbacterium sp. NPDC089189 TaxID=3154972 RepID=UPI003433416A